MKRGIRVTSKRFVLRAMPGPSTAARLGLVAGRKVAKRAVDRNRAKRLMRSIFSAVRVQLPPWDVVVQLRSDLRQAGNREIRTELAALFHNMKLRASSEV